MPTILFTPSNAREMQARGTAAKLARVKELRDTVEVLRQTVEENHEDFRQSMLMSVRLQTKQILKAIDSELERGALDVRKLKALAETLATFEAMEQKLSMRAGPGSLKPTSPKSPKTGNFAPPPPADDVQSG